MKTETHTTEARGLRVLVVEDDRVNREVLGLLLQGLGHRPETAATGAEALEWLDRRTFDLVMTDLHMPGRDGHGLLAEIRRRPTSATLPVIAVSADVMSLPAEAYPALGFAGFLSKPVVMTELRACLDRAPVGLPVFPGAPPSPPSAAAVVVLRRRGLASV